jgi:hypothetical protein
MSNSADLGTNTIGSTSAYQGFDLNFGASNLPGGAQGQVQSPYEGNINNYTAGTAQNIANSFRDQRYNGDNYNYSASSTPPTETVQLDNNTVYPFPKDQQIYYKLSGFNSNTSLYETWIITEEIVPRPEVFDPTRNPPSVDLNVFFAPPSGNKLSNIKIIARWIQ